MARRILIVHDDSTFVGSASSHFKLAGHDVTTASNGREALFHIARSLPDAVVARARLAVIDGYRLARQMRAAPGTRSVPIVLLTDDDEAKRIEGYRAGADNCVPFDVSIDELSAIVDGILDRVERNRSAIAALLQGSGIQRPLPPRDDLLTPAEWRIAELVARGMSNREISADLGLSVRTVENHIGHILAKKRFQNRVEIARFVLDPASRPRAA